MIELVLASNNAGKLAELRAVLGDLPLHLSTLADRALPSPAEPATTFIGNALIKAHAAASATGGWVLADDSGLLVDALDGAPGVISSHYAGQRATGPAHIAKLLAALRGVPDSQRTAHFHCVLVLLRGPADPAPLIAQGRWSGLVLTAPRGAGGFGYDPIFLDPELGLSAAELAAAVKNQQSHRGRALRALRAQLQPLLEPPQGA